MNNPLNIASTNSFNKLKPTDYRSDHFSEIYSELNSIRLPSKPKKPARNKPKQFKLDYLEQVDKNKAIYKDATNRHLSFALDLIREQQGFIEQGYSFDVEEYNPHTNSYDGFPKPTLTDAQGIFDEAMVYQGIKQIKITFDKNEKSILIGNYKICYPIIGFTKSEYAGIIYSALRSNGYKIPDMYQYPYVMNYINRVCIGKSIETYLRKLNYHLWVSEYEPLIKRYCRDSNGRLSQNLIYRFHKNIDEIKSAICNNEEHIIPALMYFNKNTNDIKRIAGSKAWKILLKNSGTRNSLLFFAMYYLTPYVSPDIYLNSKGEEYRSANCPNTGFGIKTINDSPRIYIALEVDQRSILLQLIHIPSSVLKKWSPFSVDGDVSSIDATNNALSRLNWVSHQAVTQKSCTSTEKLNELKILFVDTKKMALKLERPFSDNWSYRHMKQAHDIYTREYEEKYLGKFDFLFDHDWPSEVMCEDSKVLATLLKTSTDLRKEGKEMRHCVGSYCDSVGYHHSVIYALKHIESGIRSTLQIKIDGTKGNHKSIQNRGYLNKPVAAKAAKQISSAIKDMESILRQAKKIDIPKEEMKKYKYMVSSKLNDRIYYEHQD